MSFLNATLWTALLPLVFLPLVIHLLNKKFPRLFFFSSVQNIKETAAQRSRLFRWRHLILLLLRTLALVALLFAFLKPLLDRFGSAANREGKRNVLLVLDHSLSMEYRGEGVSCRKRAQAQAEKLLDTLGADDRVNILLAGQTPSLCFVDFSPNVQEARRFLERLEPGLTRADFTLANASAAQLITKSGRPTEIYYLSDFQRKNWANVDFTGIPPSARLFFVDVSTRAKDNRGVLEATVNQSHMLAGDTVALEITVGNFSDAAMNERLKVLIDQRISYEKEVSVSPWSAGKVTLPVSVGGPGLHLCEISLPPDALEQDNKYFLTLPVLEKEEILIVSDDTHPEKDAVYFLKTALNPYEQQQGSLLPRHIPSTQLTPGNLASARKVFLTRVERLTPEQCQHLGKFLFAGGGAIYFLDGKFDAENVANLERAVGPGTMPLRLASKRMVENVATGAQQVVKGDFKSRFLRLFRGATRQDLALLEFYDFYHAGATGAGNILLTYADESPAMAACDHGLGTMLFLNFSASELSSNLARQRIFPAWIQELVKQLDTHEPAPTSSVVGEPVQTEVWRTEMNNNPFKSPSNRPVTVKQEILGERYAVSFTPVELGFYTLSAGRPLYAFGVNASAEESDLRAVDKSLLPEQLPGGQAGHFVQGQEDFRNLIQGEPVFHYFIYAVLCLLLVELALQLAFKRLAA
ncbi:MAG: VWA domain-containing protein [Verrucomicrobiota bacterium]